MAERLDRRRSVFREPVEAVDWCFRGIAWRRLLGDSMVLRQHIHHRAYGLLDFRSGKGTCWCAFVSGFDCLRGRLLLCHVHWQNRAVEFGNRMYGLRILCAWVPR